MPKLIKRSVNEHNMEHMKLNVKRCQAETTVGVADSSYNRPLYVALNRLGLSAAAVALTCLFTGELIPSCVDGHITDAFLWRRSLRLLQHLNPMTRPLRAGWGEVVMAALLVVICVTEGLRETRPDSEPVKHDLPAR